MSFGLRNAPACFQRLMNRVVAGLEGVTVYLDDVVLVSNDWSSHLKRLRLLFDHLAQARLTVNLAKCETVTYLGKVVVGMLTDSDWLIKEDGAPVHRHLGHVLRCSASSRISSPRFSSSP
ncbi:hypothetical protein AALO_G00188800 [Alosa alosa]|uniref:ribonuclease H n=1 Tax=Alosa alosa TaxID=278164 RepID=A0AAV6G8B8_9TELE|nr:hypothetical protein AALO_G00188800 [Alosa alosa]